MFDLTIMDYIYVGIVLGSTVWATIRGGVYETVATLSWVLAALAARFVSPWLDGLFQNWFGLSESTIGSLVAAYFIVFFAILVIFSFINQKLRDKVQDSVLNVTDHTLGVVFGIVRGIVLMGLLYWGALWYYNRAEMPDWIAAARTRPVMQLTAVKLHDWFVPGKSPLLEKDMIGAAAAAEIYNNLINPAVKPGTGMSPETPAKGGDRKPEAAGKAAAANNNANAAATVPAPDSGTGYKESERQSLENQLLQLQAKAEADEKAEAARAAARAERANQAQPPAANGK